MRESYREIDDSSPENTTKRGFWSAGSFGRISGSFESTLADRLIFAGQYATLGVEHEGKRFDARTHRFVAV